MPLPIAWSPSTIASGERLAVSTGEAEHLNSGFLWRGKLYCANSNYPQKPDRSDIKVLDPDTMELSTWHDFGESEGSLTWAVRHDRHWWCFFAYYRDENDRSYLARFDDQWEELARWTCPPELLHHLGGYSLSGGIWHDGALLATDHDNRVLYHVDVPNGGGQLRLLEKQPAPFTGQGIAVDPVTRGLVGLNRRTHHVIFAEPTARRSGTPLPDAANGPR